MWRGLRVIAAAAALAGSLALGVGGPASARTMVDSTGWASATATVDLSWIPDKFGSTAQCQAYFRIKDYGTTFGVLAETADTGGICNFGVELNPLHCDVGDWECTDIWWTLEDAAGNALVLNGPESDGGGDYTNRVRMGKSSAVATRDFDPAQACVHVSGPSGLGDPDDHEGCTAIGLDPLGEGATAAQCIHGNAMSPKVETEEVNDGGWYTRAKVTWKQSVPQPFVGTRPQWTIYVLVKYNDPSVIPSWWENLIHPATGNPNASWWSYGYKTSYGWHGNDPRYSPDGILVGPTYEYIQLGYKSGSTHYGFQGSIIGVGMFQPAMQGATNNAIRALPGLSTWTDTAYGLQDPGNCQFYFGDKVWTIAGTEVDEPGGNLNVIEPPDDPPPPEPPTEDDPDANWLALIWAVLKGILTAVSGIVSGVVSGILGGLYDLFVPSPSSWDTEGVVDQFSTRPPGSVAMDAVVTVDTFLDGYSASGCGVMAEFEAPGHDGTITCTEVRQSTGMTVWRNCWVAFLWGTTAWGVFKILHRAIGAGS